MSESEAATLTTARTLWAVYTRGLVKMEPWDVPILEKQIGAVGVRRAIRDDNQISNPAEEEGFVVFTLWYTNVCGYLNPQLAYDDHVFLSTYLSQGNTYLRDKFIAVGRKHYACHGTVSRVQSGVKTQSAVDDTRVRLPNASPVKLDPRQVTPGSTTLKRVRIESDVWSGGSLTISVAHDDAHAWSDSELPVAKRLRPTHS